VVGAAVSNFVQTMRRPCHVIRVGADVCPEAIGECHMAKASESCVLLMDDHQACLSSTHGHCK